MAVDQRQSATVATVPARVTAQLMRRNALVGGVVWSAALLVLVVTESPAAHAFADGILLPGGGFLATGDFLLFAVALVAFAVAFAAWFVVGIIVAPPLVWLGAAGLAAARAGGGSGWPAADIVVPVALGAIVVGGVIGHRVRVRRSVARSGDQRIGRIASPKLSSTPMGTAGAGGEHSLDDLAFLRYILDLALQPIDGWDGFEWVEFQFREGAVRYQLNYAQWGLALAQYTRTPAFTGYLAEAQRNLIEKMLHRRVWKYWRWENLWGNLRYNPDPIIRDNIMLSGYYALMLTTYEAVTGDHRYDEPGRLSFRWNDRRVFSYDFPAIAEALRRNFAASRYCLFPCEPNWIYPICNMIGMTGLVGFDRRHGTDLSAGLVERFGDIATRDFTSVDGRAVGLRSSRTGITLPGLAYSALNDAGLAFWASPLYPEDAERSWERVRDRTIEITDDGHAVVHFQSIADRLDVGSMRLTWGPIPYAFLTAAALEMGDDDAYRAICLTLQDLAPQQHENGRMRYPASTVANMMLAPGRFGARRAWHDLVNHGLPEHARRGPVLTDAPYPAALVARAVTDGSSLELVLVPGEGPCRANLRVDHLAPGHRYRVSGATEPEVLVDAHGRASFAADLAGRTEISITPVR